MRRSGEVHSRCRSSPGRVHGYHATTWLGPRPRRDGGGRAATPTGWQRAAASRAREWLPGGRVSSCEYLSNQVNLYSFIVMSGGPPCQVKIAYLSPFDERGALAISGDKKA